MSIKGKHVAVLVHNYFEQSEFEEPIGALKDAGAEVTVISADKTDLTGMQHVEMGDSFEADLLLNQATPEDYDALILPGGTINADNLRVIEEAKEWVIDFLNQEKPLAVICHAPWVLASADVLEGRRLTSYHTIRDDLINAGGDWVDQPVVIDGSLITSRRPEDLPQFNNQIIKMLEAQKDSVLRTGAENLVSATEVANEEDLRLKTLGYLREEDEINDSDEGEILEDEELSDSSELQPSHHGHVEEYGDSY